MMTNFLFLSQLHSAANFVLTLAKEGLINEKEAEEMIEDTYTKNEEKLLQDRDHDLEHDHFHEHEA